jgi:hypothetical protein
MESSVLNHQMPVTELIRGKKVIGYGAGLSLYQTHAALPLPLAYVVDDAPGLAGTTACGVPVYSSERLSTENSADIFVVIYADSPGAIFKIASSLDRLNLVWGQQYVDCALIHFESMAPRLRRLIGAPPSWQRFHRARIQRFLMSPESRSFIAGTWLYTELLDNYSARVPGDIAECGVYKGGNVLSTLLISELASSRPYRLFDSFDGFPDFSEHDPASRRQEFQDVDFGMLQNMFRNFPNVVIHKGWFRDTLPIVPERIYSMVYVDCDLYEPTLELCEYFYPRISKGGCLLFHDYWFPEQELPHQIPFRGVKAAVSDFFGAATNRLVVFPETTHAVLIKD